MAADASGILDRMTLHGLRQMTEQWGYLGVLMYFVLFVIGQLLYVPGVLFVIFAGLVYGGGTGFLYAMAGGILSASVSFYVVRLIGGKALIQSRHPFVKRMMSKLEEKPVFSIFLLRVFFTTSPFINYGLALSESKFRHYLIGSTLGFIPLFLLVTQFCEWILINWY